MYSIVLGGVSILFLLGGIHFLLRGRGEGGGGRRDLSLVSISFAGYYAFGRRVHFIWGSLFIGGVGHFLGVVFLLACMGYGVVPATPPHEE